MCLYNTFITLSQFTHSFIIHVHTHNKQRNAGMLLIKNHLHTSIEPIMITQAANLLGNENTYTLECSISLQQN